MYQQLVTRLIVSISYYVYKITCISDTEKYCMSVQFKKFSISIYFTLKHTHTRHTPSIKNSFVGELSERENIFSWIKADPAGSSTGFPPSRHLFLQVYTRSSTAVFTHFSNAWAFIVCLSLTRCVAYLLMF